VHLDVAPVGRQEDEQAAEVGERPGDPRLLADVEAEVLLEADVDPARPVLDGETLVEEARPRGW
jgi:hypothetical protein